MIMVDKQKKQHVSYAVGSKIVSDWVVRLLCEDLDTWGYVGKPLILGTDWEPSIKAWRRSISGFRQDNTQPAYFPPGEHESMGFDECMVKSTRKQFKTVRDALESKSEIEIPRVGPRHSVGCEVGQRIIEQVPDRLRRPDSVRGTQRQKARDPNMVLWGGACGTRSCTQKEGTGGT